MNDVAEKIKSELDENNVVLFMKGTPDFPQCGFSSVAVQILQYLGVDFKSINILLDDAMREGIKAYAQWPTIPQLYVNKEFVGGCDIIREMFEAGELQEFFNEQGIATSIQNNVS